MSSGGSSSTSTVVLGIVSMLFISSLAVGGGYGIYYLITQAQGPPPPDRVLVGGKVGDKDMYVCVGDVKGNTKRPGRTWDGLNACEISWNGGVEEVVDYSVLKPDRAVGWYAKPRTAAVLKFGGDSNAKRRHAVCRAKLSGVNRGRWTPGVTYPGHHTCWIAGTDANGNRREFFADKNNFQVLAYVDDMQAPTTA